jgi:hypothetical protein
MQIHPAQVVLFGEAASIDKVSSLLIEADPKAATALASPEGKKILRQQFEKAQGYGLTSELDIGRYLITAWLMGLDFDTRFPAMQEILTAPRGSSEQKAEAIEKVSIALFKTLQGA